MSPKASPTKPSKCPRIATKLRKMPVFSQSPPRSPQRSPHRKLSPSRQFFSASLPTITFVETGTSGGSDGYFLEVPPVSSSSGNHPCTCGNMGTDMARLSSVSPQHDKYEDIFSSLCLHCLFRLCADARNQNEFLERQRRKTKENVYGSGPVVDGQGHGLITTSMAITRIGSWRDLRRPSPVSKATVQIDSQPTVPPVSLPVS